MNTERSFLHCSDRYSFDWNQCSFKNGFAQIDTCSDASYFGQWANPETLEIVCYIEGDVIEKTADTPAEFVEELRSMKAWHIEQGERFAIDGMCQPSIIEGFTAIGAADLLH